MGDYEVILDGGGPWGIRLQGGKDFGIPLNIAKVTLGSKAGAKGLMAGDSILEINGHDTTNLKHVDAQNLIKSAGNRLQLKLKAGKGASLGDIKQVGSGGFAAAPSQTLYQTDVTHSAGVDYKFNSKPRAFGAASAAPAPPSAPPTATPGAKKFDPAEYARKKKEELDRYKEEQNKNVAVDSDVLKMLQRTSISGQGEADAGSFSRLQNQLANEGQWQDEEKAFRMTTNKDMSDVSPGSRAIMEDIKSRGTTGLTKSGAPSGGSKSFKYLQQLTDEDDDEPVSPENCLKTHTEKKSMDMNNNNNNNEQQTFKMTANNPYHLPIKAVITNDDNPIMDSLKTKMKEMNINKDRLDRTHSVSSTGKKNQYLSQTSRNTAERPASPSPLVPPKSPTFRMTLERGGNPFAGPSGDVISSLKQQIAGDRMTLGLKQTRGLKASPSMSRIQKHLSGGVQPLPASKLSEDNSVPDPFDSHEYYSSSVSTSLPRSLDFSYRDIIRDMTQVKTKKPEDHYEKLIFEKKRRLTPPSLRRSNSLRSKSVSSMSASPVTKRSDSFTKNFYDKYNIDEQKRSMEANICKSTSFDEQSLAGNENKEEQRHPLKSRHTIDNSGLSPSKNEPPGKTATLPYFIDNIVIPEQEKKIEEKESLSSHAISKPIPFTQSSFHDNLVDANNDYFENLQKTLEEIYSPTELLKFDLSTNAPIKDDIFLYSDNKKSRKSNRDNIGSNKANTDNINLKNKTVENVNQSYIDTKGVTKIVENKKPLHTNNFEFVNQKSYQKTDLEDPINVKEAYTSPEKANYRERKKAATDYKKGIPKDCLKDKKDEPKKKVTELSKMNHFENDSSTIITKSENFPKPIICLGSLTSTCTVTDVVSGTRPKKHVRFKDDIDLIEKFIFDNTKYFNDRFRIEDLAAYEEFIKQIQEAESFFRDNSYYNDIGYDDTDNAPDNKKDNASINNLDNADLQFVADIPTNNYDENAANELNSTSVEPNHNEVDKTMKIDHYIQTLYEKYSIDELLRSRKPVVTNRIDSLLQKYDFHLDNIDSPIPDEYQQKIADQKAARLHQVSPNIEMFKQSHQPSTDRFVPTNYSARSSPPRQSFLRKQAASSPNENTNELSQILRNRHKKLRDYEEEIEKEKILDNLSITKTPYTDTSTILQDIDKNAFIQDDTSIESLLESLDDFVAKREADSSKKDLSKEISQSPNKQSDDTKENNKEEMISSKDASTAKSENIKPKIRLQKRVSLDYPTKKTNPLERADDQDPCIHDDNVILNFLSFEKNKGVRPYFDSDKPNLDYSPRKYRSLSEGSVPKIDRPLYSSGQRSKSPTVDYNIHVKRGSISMTTMSTKRGVKQATPVLAMNHVNKPLTLFLRKDTLPPSSSDEEEL